MSQVDVTIMGVPYRLSCKDDEEAKLREVAALVDTKMCAIRDGSRIRGNDRIAVMACLSIAAELLVLKAPDAPIPENALSELREKTDSMTRLIESAMKP